MKRNASIDITKAVFAIIILLFHVKNKTSLIICPSGHVAVDYYLITAGCYLFIKAEKAGGATMAPHSYFVHRFRRFFAGSTVAFCFAYAIDVYIRKPPFTFDGVIKEVSNHIWELLMIHWTGIGNAINGPAWTISTLLLMGTLIYGGIYCNKKVFTSIIIPTSLILGFGIWSHLEKQAYNTWLGCVYFSTFRTYVDMLIGYYCVLFAKSLMEKGYGKNKRLALSMIEILSILFTIYIMMTKSGLRYQYLCILLFFFSISISLSEISIFHELLQKYSKITALLAEVAFSLYLMHGPIIKLYDNIIQSWDSKRKLLVFFVIMCVAVVIHWFITKIVNDRMQKNKKTQ